MNYLLKAKEEAQIFITTCEEGAQKNRKRKIFYFKNVVVSGLNKASHMIGKHCIIKLSPQPKKNNI